MDFGRLSIGAGLRGAEETTGRAARIAAADAATRFSIDPEPNWSEPEREPRDWKKIALVLGLGALSWVATYVGMLELIEANMGDLPLTHKIIIGFSVAMLMTMIIWLLDQLFAPIPTFTKFVYAVGYIFLSIISIGFGFGFYWKVLESRAESSRSAESAVTQVQASLHAASTRLDQLSTTLVQLTQFSSAQAEVERVKGTTCPNSRPGDGPRRRLRDEDAARFTFASDFVKGRAGQVKTELGALDGDLAKIAASDPSLIDPKSGTRNEFMKSLGRKLDLTVTGFNAFRTDPQLRQIRTDLAERAEKTTFADTKGGTFACPDPQLQTALRGVVRAIDQLPDLEKPKIAAVEGSEATIEAFRRLTATFYGALAFKLPPSADELRDLQKKAVQSVEQPNAAARRALSAEGVGLSRRDYIPLAIAAFVDFCLLLVSMGRPANRLTSLVGKMREAEKGPVIQILSRFNDIHRDPVVRQNFEVFRHVVFDFHGAYYVAVPLDAPYRFKKVHGAHGIGTAQLEELQQEAHLLANLFASFEKERIFTRVYTPLLSTKAIQKKLWRQGSKFAGSEAFRVYRFRDGAWSELILGAVMGAARRVEAAKRQRRIGEEIAHALSPTADLTAATQPDWRADWRDETRSAGHAHPDEGDDAWSRSVRSGARSSQQGYRRPARAAAEETYPTHPQRRQETHLREGPLPTGRTAEHSAVTEDDALRYGPYASYATRPQPVPRASDEMLQQTAAGLAVAANGNTAPHESAVVPVAAPRTAHAPAPSVGSRAEPAVVAAGLPANVTPLPNVAVRPQGVIEPAAVSPVVSRTADVMPRRADQPAAETHIVLSRTETISIPATAASLPQGLLRAGFGGAAE